MPKVKIDEPLVQFGKSSHPAAEARVMGWGVSRRNAFAQLAMVHSPHLLHHPVALPRQSRVGYFSQAKLPGATGHHDPA
jgi:hypothetical protein